jgi:hypothetical protein
MSNFNRENLYTRTFQDNEEPVTVSAWFYALALGLIALLVIMQ